METYNGVVQHAIIYYPEDGSISFPRKKYKVLKNTVSPPSENGDTEILPEEYKELLKNPQWLDPLPEGESYTSEYLFFVNEEDADMLIEDLEEENSEMIGNLSLLYLEVLN